MHKNLYSLSWKIKGIGESFLIWSSVRNSPNINIEQLFITVGAAHTCLNNFKRSLDINRPTNNFFYDVGLVNVTEGQSGTSSGLEMCRGVCDSADIKMFYL